MSSIHILIGGLMGVISICHGNPTTEQCDYINSIGCHLDYRQSVLFEHVCGTDGVTYLNFCEYSQARCRSNTLSIQSIGTCPDATPPPPTTTVSTANMQHTYEILQSIFCSNLHSINCDTKFEPICGTDGVLYLNSCEFSRERCNQTDLSVRHLDFCGSFPDHV